MLSNIEQQIRIKERELSLLRAALALEQRKQLRPLNIKEGDTVVATKGRYRDKRFLITRIY